MFIAPVFFSPNPNLLLFTTRLVVLFFNKISLLIGKKKFGILGQSSQKKHEVGVLGGVGETKMKLNSLTVYKVVQ